MLRLVLEHNIYIWLLEVVELVPWLALAFS